MRLWRSCTIWRLALVLHERALADRVGVPFRDFQRPVEDLLGSHAAIDKALDLAAPEMAAGLEASFGGGGYTALQCSALLQLAWDHVSSALDGRESAFELHASGGMANWRSWLRRSFK